MRFFSVLRSWSILVIAGTCIWTQAASAAIRHVDLSASTNGPQGTQPDWSDCFNNLDSALSAAADGDEIRVAGATGSGYTYKAPTGTSPYFLINKRIKVFGGWPGLANPSASNPDPDTYITILSGDQSGNDFFTASSTPDGSHTYGNYGDNNAVIVRFENPSSGAALNDTNCILQGFTIRGATEKAVQFASGSPMVRECIIKWNHSDYSGAGMSLGDNEPIIRNCTFLENEASLNGGAILGSGAPKVLHCILYSETTAPATRVQLRTWLEVQPRL